MTMSHNGLTKLIEECSEVIQVAAKAQAFPPKNGFHPDGKGSLILRLEEEIADVEAVIRLVKSTYNLNCKRMEIITETKYELFTKWHSDPNV